MDCVTGLFPIAMKTRAVLISLAVMLLSSLPAAAVAVPEYRLAMQVAGAMGYAGESLFDLEYANVDGYSLKLDLLLPDGPGPHPVIVSIHGGSWTKGTRNDGIAFLQVARGYAVANIDYRLAPDSIYPAQIQDVKAAVRWLRANAERFDLNPNAVGAMGYSAGGHLAALLGTTGDVDVLDGTGHGNLAFSSRVQAVVDYFGPTDFLKIAEQAPACTPGDANDPAAPPSVLIGCPIQDCPDKAAAANPITYVTPNDTPFLILHGLADCLVPWQQSQLLHDALVANGVESKLILAPGLDHGSPLFLLPQFQREVETFIDRHLKNRPVRRTRPARR